MNGKIEQVGECVQIGLFSGYEHLWCCMAAFQASGLDYGGGMLVIFLSEVFENRMKWGLV